MSVFAIYNLKGGVGKTTTAVNLAHACSQDGRATLLWDLDPQAAATFAFRVKAKVSGFGRKALRDGDRLLGAIRGTDFDCLDLLPAEFAIRKLDRMLERLPDADSGLRGVVDAASNEYQDLFLDCPPGFSLLTESIFAVADVILIPTIPTVLSLRTMPRIFRKAARGTRGTRLRAFLCMVDARKTLHRRICDWAESQPGIFLEPRIPYASVVEQMSVRRSPLAAFAPGDPATRAYQELWEGAKELVRADSDFRGDQDPEQELLSFAAPIEAFVLSLRRSDRESISAPAAVEEVDEVQQQLADASAVLRCAVRDGAEFERLAAAVDSRPVRLTQRVEHTFDTRREHLRLGGYRLQLREENGRFLVQARGPDEESTAAGAVNGGTAEAVVDRPWAVKILAGEISPLQVLARRLGNEPSELVREVKALVGKNGLRRIDSGEASRWQFGPAFLDGTDGGVRAEFVLDIPGAAGLASGRPAADGAECAEIQPACELLVRADCESVDALQGPLQDLFARAGVEFRPVG